MSDLPLPGLTPDDPESKLSYEARQRIAVALLEFDRLRKQARSAIELRGDWDTPQAHIDMRQADMEATRIVLRAEAAEYGRLGLPHRDFREIIRTKIEEFVYSLEFSNLQRDALEAEFLWSSRRERPAPVPAEVSPADEKPKPESAGKQVKAFMKKKGLDNSAFAKLIGMSERQVGSVLADAYVGKATRRAVAKALGTTPEELFRE